MKVIFCDVDGVIVTSWSQESRRAFGHPNADSECVKALNHIIAETGAHIVVSSQWRIDRSLPELRQILNVHFGVRGRVIGKTPRLFKHQSISFPDRRPSRIEVTEDRGKEIDRWIHEWAEGPVGQFVILDDDADMEPHMKRLVQTQFQSGLTMEDAWRAIAILKGGAA